MCASEKCMAAAVKRLGMTHTMRMTTSRYALSTTVRTSCTSVPPERGLHRLNKERRMSELRVDGIASDARHVQGQRMNSFRVVLTPLPEGGGSGIWTSLHVHTTRGSRHFKSFDHKNKRSSTNAEKNKKKSTLIVWTVFSVL